MDYIGRLRQLASPRPRSPAELRAQTLEKFMRSWKTIHDVYFVHEDQLARGIAQTPIPKSLQIMCNQLIKESSSSVSSQSESSSVSPSSSMPNEPSNQTGACFEFALKHGCFQLLADMASADFPQGMFKETLVFFTTLVEMMGKSFLIPCAVHQPVTKLLRSCQDESIAGNCQEEVSDLAYAFCAQIRSSPDLLCLFLLDQNLSRSPSKESLNSQKEKENHQELKPDFQFPLFSILIKFVGNSGKPGDYARTGLSFLIELDNPTSRQYIFSDYNLSQVIINTLCNIYMQLPQQLGSYSASMHAIQKLNLSNVSLVPPSPAEKSLVRNSEIYNINTAQTLLDVDANDLMAFLNVLSFADTIVNRLENASGDLVKLFDAQFVLETFIPSYRESFMLKNSFIVISAYLENILTTLSSKRLLENLIAILFGHNETSLRSTLLNMVTTSEEAVVQAILKILYVLFDKHGNFVFPLLISSPHTIPINMSILSELHGRVVDRYLHFLSSFTHYNFYVDDASSIILPKTEIQNSSNSTTLIIDSMESLQKATKDVSDDVFLQTVLTLLDHFLDQSPATNLLVTGLIRAILLQPYGIVHLFMTSGDDLSDVRSLYTVLQYLYSKVDVENMRKKYVEVEKLNLNGNWTKLNFHDASERDKEKISVLNAMILDEFVKEVIGCMQAQALAY